MKAVSLRSDRHLSAPARPGVLDGLARRAVLGQLGALTEGVVVIEEAGARHVYGHRNADGLRAVIRVHSGRFWGDIAFSGSIGAGESYMQGYWDCDDLVALMRIMARNREVLMGMDRGSAALGEPLRRLFHWVNRNTRAGARRNISAHYDLGNDFFALWLDESMMYSCAIFEREDMSLAEAQRLRLDRVCQQLELGPDDHLLEIGTGWGGLAIHAAREYGCQVTTTTISAEQHDEAVRRIDAAGLADRITLLQEDYRDLDGTYDKLISLEMIEAIGYRQFDEYFTKCQQLLRRGGRLLIQSITIDDAFFDEYRKGVDFIQRYIFPGGCLPSVAVMREAIDRHTDLVIDQVEDIGLHYATTLEHWRHAFHARLDEVRALGYSETFIRMWDYYYCYCMGGFLERSTGDVLLSARRPA